MDEEDLALSEEDDPARSAVVPAVSLTRNPLDYRMEEVINQYNAPSSQPLDEYQDGPPNVFSNEDIASIADEVTRMPNDNDPPLWRVRVHVSLSQFLLFFNC